MKISCQGNKFWFEIWSACVAHLLDSFKTPSFRQFINYRDISSIIFNNSLQTIVLTNSIVSLDMHN